MLTKDFYFDLPDELIAQTPSEKRGEDRLLVLDRNTGSYKDCWIKDLPGLLAKDTVLVVNNSKVRKARVFGLTALRAKVEFLFLNANEDGSWNCIVKRLKRQREGSVYTFVTKDGYVENTATLEEKREDGTVRLVFSSPVTETFFEACGHVPLPPYIKREDMEEDELRYQTIYARELGSVAAPTAGLHFTPELLEDVKKLGIPVYEVTLHVGAGTFFPVRTENIEEHHMHTEHYSMTEETMQALNEAKASRKRILAVGTTSMRTLESAADSTGRLVRREGDTDIFIYPGYSFRFVDDLLTNFHTPESTLLMLVSALAGKENIMKAYEHAISERYYFFSYGDAMLIKG